MVWYTYDRREIALPPYLIRYLGRRGERPRFWIADPTSLRVSYKKHTRLKRDLGWAHEVEEVGDDRSTVRLRARSDDARSARGSQSPIQHLQVRLLDRHQHVRHLAKADEQALAAIDERIAAKEAELKAIRDEREAAVEAAWRRAGKVPISELEEKANA